MEGRGHFPDTRARSQRGGGRGRTFPTAIPLPPAPGGGPLLPFSFRQDVEHYSDDNLGELNHRGAIPKSVRTESVHLGMASPQSRTSIRLPFFMPSRT